MQRGPIVPTTHQGAPPGPRRALVSCALLEHRLEPFFWHKKDNLWEKRVKFSAQSELQISENLRNHEGPDLGNAKQKRIERKVQSWRGLRPSAAMEAMYQRGTLLPSRGEAKEEKGGVSLPLSPGAAGTSPGQGS